MTSFEESLHPRTVTGRFAKKVNCPPAGALTSAVDVGHLRARSDGRYEVADESESNSKFGCQIDDWCILANGHDGVCNEQREDCAGADKLYPESRANQEPVGPTVQWHPGDTRMIAGSTNPWLQAADGQRIDLLTLGYEGRIPREEVREFCDSCDSEPVPGALSAMDSEYGIQRCDECGLIEGDLEAAAAVAKALTKGGEFGEVTVWFETEPDERTPEEALAEYRVPRAEDWAEAREGAIDELYWRVPAGQRARARLEALVDGDRNDVVERRAKVLGELRAAGRMYVDGITHPGEDLFEDIWAGRSMGRSEADVRTEIYRLRKMRTDLAGNIIRPAHVIGTGYKGDTRKLANQYLDRQEAEHVRALETRGRSLSVNASNVDYRLRNRDEQ